MEQLNLSLLGRRCWAREEGEKVRPAAAIAQSGAADDLGGNRRLAEDERQPGSVQQEQRLSRELQ